MNILDYLPKGISTVEYHSEEDWLEERRKGIGGSDVGVVMGLNKYKSKRQLFVEKTTGQSKDLSGNTFVKKGKDLEDLIRNKYVVPYMKELGYNVHTINEILTHSEVPYIRANLDAFAIPENWKGNHLDNIVIEIKWVSEYASVNWDGDDYFGIPASYYAQVQAYMAVTGASKAIVCALFDEDWTVKFYEIPANYDFRIKMLQEVKFFMEGHIQMNIAPMINAELDKEIIVESLKQPTTNTIQDEDMNELIMQYRDIKNSLKDLEKKASGILSYITDRYLQGYRPTSPLCKVSISVVHSTKFDSTRFKEEHPDMYKEYLTESEYSRTTIK